MNVVFDLGGVLIQWQTAQLLQEALPEVDLTDSPLLQIFAGPEWLAYDRGEYTEAEAFASISARLPDDAESIERVAAVWRDHLVPIPANVSLLEKLTDSGIKAYALSNFARQSFAMVFDRNPWMLRFTGMMVSGHFGVLKPEPAIFDQFLRHYSLDPATCLFIDDHADNVAAAAAAGMQTYLYSGAAALETELRRRGLLV
ncbi:MAG: HAD family phosphatase [Candidatus Sericytochromatia bacterium]|nr:HAD family phosphatase [Candidatus Sericytochromatia bacterium]